MCIRDRGYIDGEENKSPNQIIDDLVDIVSKNGNLLLNIGCLLYTSDAADERSSVDLGGRRIIKKKKTDT